MSDTGIFWIRDDFRLEDNPALSFATQNHESVIALFIYNNKNFDNQTEAQKWWVSKSLEAFKRAESKLKDCGCEVSYNHAYDAMQLLEKVDPAESYEDGRFFVKRARDLAKECIIELDKCTAENQEDNSLSLLQDEQKELQQQQLLLKQITNYSIFIL